MKTKEAFLPGIKGKLISAVAMLLVAIIMVVSSTYAWFTLSTAPEVSGISTAIGANGALEIRLNTDSDPSNTDRNGTYGNLVDLSQGIYGLDKIVLLPSKLVYADGANTVLANHLLGIPAYSSDGKPDTSTLSNKATYGTYVGNSFLPQDSETLSNGVNAIGVASGLTDRQIAFRNAKSTASTNMGLAKTAAKNSLATHGTNLSSIVMKKATNDNATFTQEELGYLDAIVQDLNRDGGVLEYIQVAYEQQIVAFAASQAATTAVGGDVAKSDLIFNYISANIGDGKAITLESIAENNGIVLPTEISDTKVNLETAASQAVLDGIKKFIATKNNVALAAQGIETLKTAASEEMSWDDLSTNVLKYILAYNEMSINGVLANEVMSKVDVLIQSVAGGGGIKVQMNSGAGVYADIADHCGDYSAAITIKELSYKELNVKDMPASMMTVTSVSPSYLKAASTLVAAAGEPEGAGTQKMAMTEFYGYVLDLVFRTNATGSNLLLQTDPADRIYSDNQNEATQGGGSFMAFKATEESFTDAQIKALMSAIRIVFFDTAVTADQPKTVLAYARLDTENAATDANGALKANMYLYTTVYEYEYEGDSGNVSVYCKSKGDTAFYSDVACTTTATIPEGKTPAYKSDKDVAITNTSDAIIKALPQNNEVKISALVYFDGDAVQNKDVAATKTTSLQGSMNLQFSSSAELTPMEYGDLHIKGEAPAGTETAPAA